MELFELRACLIRNGFFQLSRNAPIMNRMYLALAVSIFICFLVAPVKVCEGQDRANQNNVPDLSGAWRIEWDDTVDGKLSDKPKRCFVKLASKGRKLTGEFKGRVVGQKRDAKFSGEVFGGNAPLVQLIQREKGYTCVYQIYWSPGPNKIPRGVWHDTRGASGEFSMLKFQ